MYADNTLTPRDATRLCALGTLAIGRAGAVNAALFAAAILALADPDVAVALDTFRAEQAAAVPEVPQE